jgi:hypothetical protein
VNPRKEARSVEIYTTDVAAAPVGAAFFGVCSARTSRSVTAVNHARTQNPLHAAGAPDARLAAFRPVPAMTQRLAILAEEPLAANGTRKQNVHKTRIGAGGYGAMGPHPEREPAY